MKYISFSLPFPHSKSSQATLLKRKQKDFKSERNSKFAVRLGLLEISNATPIRSHEHDCLHMS